MYKIPCARYPLLLFLNIRSILVREDLVLDECYGDQESLDIVKHSEYLVSGGLVLDEYLCDQEGVEQLPPSSGVEEK